jgi:hypothetical protein
MKNQSSKLSDLRKDILEAQAQLMRISSQDPKFKDLQKSIFEGMEKLKNIRLAIS